MDGLSIRKISTSDEVSTLKLSYSKKTYVCISSGTGSLALDDLGNIFYSTDFGVCKIAPDNSVEIFAGNPDVGGSFDGNGTNASFSFVWGIAIDSKGYIYVGDYGNKTIRRIDQEANVVTVSGHPGVLNTDLNDKTRLTDEPEGIVVNGNSLYILLNSGVGVIHNLP